MLVMIMAAGPTLVFKYHFWLGIGNVCSGFRHRSGADPSFSLECLAFAERGSL